MMISVAAITFDMSGFVEFEPLADSDFGNLARRYNKTRTLDGGVVASDYGFTHADRNFEISLIPTLSQDATLRYLVENHAQVYVSTREGVFKGIPEYSINEGRAVLALSVTEEMS